MVIGLYGILKGGIFRSYHHLPPYGRDGRHYPQKPIWGCFGWLTNYDITGLQVSQR